MAESIKTKVHSLFVERAPNHLTVDNLVTLLGGLSTNQIETALNQLIEEGFIVERKGKIKDDYALSSYDNIPSKQYINISGVKVPRLLANDVARPEDVNVFFESLAKKTGALEDDFERRVDEKLKAYWANIIVLFGLFIGVFSLIITFVEKVELKSGETFWNVFLLNSAQVLPLALVLAGFVFLLKKLFK